MKMSDIHLKIFNDSNLKNFLGHKSTVSGLVSPTFPYKLNRDWPCTATSKRGTKRVRVDPFPSALKREYWDHDPVMFMGISTQISRVPKGQIKQLKVYLLIAKNNYQDTKSLVFHL